MNMAGNLSLEPMAERHEAVLQEMRHAHGDH